jgi:hypothetical protein
VGGARRGLDQRRLEIGDGGRVGLRAQAEDLGLRVGAVFGEPAGEVDAVCRPLMNRGERWSVRGTVFSFTVLHM